MKKATIIQIILFGILMFGCSSPKPLKQEGVQSYKKQSKTQKVKNRNAKLISKFSFYQEYKKKDGTFYIVQDGKIIYDNLKYVKILFKEKNGNKIQIIDAKNKAHIVFIKADEEQVVEPPLLFCGNGSMTHKINIIKSNKYIKVDATARYLDELETKLYKDAKKTHLVTKVDKSKADELFFHKNKDQIEFYENEGKPMYAIYYKKDNKYGFFGDITVVRKKKKILYNFKKSKDNKRYDILEFKAKNRILLGREGMLGYHKLTPVKYKVLNDFEENLARFELPDGRKGYIDTEGNEYYD